MHALRIVLRMAPAHPHCGVSGISQDPCALGAGRRIPLVVRAEGATEPLIGLPSSAHSETCILHGQTHNMARQSVCSRHEPGAGHLTRSTAVSLKSQA